MFVLGAILMACAILVVLWVSRARSAGILDYPTKEGVKKVLMVTSNKDLSIGQYSLPVMQALCSIREYDFVVTPDRFAYAAEHMSGYDAVYVVSDRVVFVSASLDLAAMVPTKIGASESCRHPYLCDNLSRAWKTGDFDELIRTAYSDDFVVVDPKHPSARAVLLRISSKGYPPDDDSIQPLPMNHVAHATAAYGLLSSHNHSVAMVCDRADVAAQMAGRVRGDLPYYEDVLAQRSK